MQKQTFFAFDTVVTLSAYCQADLLEKAVKRCLFFENAFSRTLEGSDVWRINHAGGAPVTVSAETADCIKTSLEYSRQTQGLFDATIGAVSCLWDFQEGIKPNDEAIKDTLAHVDYRKVSVDGNTVQLLDPQAQIDLGGIAKGFIADDLVSLFALNGCHSALLDLGGNISCIGTKPDGNPWKVGIQDPNGMRTNYLATVEACNQAVVTSGIYERCFTLDGTTYHHILDPRTGHPAQTDLTSCTLIANGGIQADALATAAFLMNTQQAPDMLEQSGASGLLVDAEDKQTLFGNAPIQLAQDA